MSKQLTSLALIAVSSLFLAGCTKQGSPEAQPPSETISAATKLADAIKSGTPTKCSMTKDKDEMEYLISGKKIRVNTTTNKVDEKGVLSPATSHMINDTAYLYTWDDKTKQGSKMTMPTEEEAKAFAESAKQYQAGSTPTPKLESEADYQDLKDQGFTVDCKAESVDDSVFVPPTDIKFIDAPAMMKAIPSPDANGKYDMSKLQELEKKYSKTSPADN